MNVVWYLLFLYWNQRLHGLALGGVGQRRRLKGREEGGEREGGRERERERGREKRGREGESEMERERGSERAREEGGQRSRLAAPAGIIGA